MRRMGRRETYTGLGVGQSEGKRPLGRPGRRWKNDIEMSLQGNMMARMWIVGWPLCTTI